MLLLAALTAAGSATASNKGRLNLPNATIPLGASYTITGRTGAPDGKLPNMAMAWGTVVKNDLAFVNDLNSGLWIVRLEPKTKIVP